MASVTASEFAKNFGHYQDEAQREPVEIISQGRTVGYFIAPRDYNDLLRLREREAKAYRIEDVPPELMKQILESRVSPEHDHLNALLDDNPVAMPVEDLTPEELDSLEQSEIPEETKALDRLVPKGW